MDKSMVLNLLDNNYIDTIPEEDRADCQKKIKQIIKNLEIDDFDDLTVQDIVNAFHAAKIKKNYLLKNKTIILVFLRWLYKNGYLANNSFEAFEGVKFEDIFTTDEIWGRYYFKNWQDLYSFAIEPLNHHVNQYMTFQVAVIFLWHGISLKDCVDILKTDYDAATRSIIHPVSNERIIFPNEAATIISQYRDLKFFQSDQFSNQSDAIRYECGSGIYLFRNRFSSHMTYKQLASTNISAIRIINTESKRFRWTNVEFSRDMMKMYLYEQQYGDLKWRRDMDIVRLLHPSVKHEINTKKFFDDYQKWKQYFYFK